MLLKLFRKVKSTCTNVSCKLQVDGLTKMLTCENSPKIYFPFREPKNTKWS